MAIDIAVLKERAATTLADPATALADYKTAAEALKALADYEKSTADVANQVRILRYEGVKSASTGIVPLLTLITLAITVYFQWSQAKITDAANEDARWKTVTETLTKPTGPTTDAVALTSLTPFFNSDRYWPQAYETAFLLVGQMASNVAFESLFRSAFGRATWSNMRDMRRLNDILMNRYDEVNGVFERLGGWDALQNAQKSSGKKPPVGMPNPRDIEGVAHARQQINNEQMFLANQIADMLREPRPSGGAPFTDFTRFAFVLADLSKADLSGLDLTGARFDNANVAGATLAPTKFDDSFWYATNWWQAAKIDGALLKHLMATAGPYTHSGETDPQGPDGRQIERADYVKELTRLCVAAGITCDLDKAAFGPLAGGPGTDAPNPPQ